MNNKENIKAYLPYIIGAILLIPALLINLGILNIYMAVDEATRSLPALEMKLSGNYITPTILGEYYYNKPPLFNWLLASLFSLFGYSEFVLRLPTVISFIGFGFSIYYFVSKEYGKQTGALTAILFVTFGRLLFWETYLGYIDTTFSWVMYLSFMSIFYFHKRKQYWKLFIISWLLTTIAFMLKGLPAIVYQGITLLVFFINEKRFKQLFSWPSIAGGVLFIALVGSYYLIYNQYNSLENVFPTLWSQSTQRTVVGHGWFESWKHLIKFPTEMFYHYAPWTFLLVFVFGTGLMQKIKTDSFLRFSFWVFIFNVIVYWTSPDVYPKYIMPIMPLLLVVLVRSYLDDFKEDGIRSRIIHWIFIGFAFILSMGFLICIFIPQLNHPKASVFILILLFIPATISAYMAIKDKQKILVWMAVILIIGRIFFDIYVWPLRVSEFVQFEKDSDYIAEITSGQKLQIYKKKSWAYGTYYYLSLYKEEIIHTENHSPQPKTFYITGKEGESDIIKQGVEFETIYEFIDPQDKQKIKLIKTK